jgi:hypothetical protein
MAILSRPELSSATSSEISVDRGMEVMPTRIRASCLWGSRGGFCDFFGLGTAAYWGPVPGVRMLNPQHRGLVEVGRDLPLARAA